MKLRENCFKQQILNAMNATLSQNGLGEHRLHEVPPLNTTETSTVIVPAHFLAVWRSFLITIQSDKSGTTKKDQLVEQLVPLFHNPNIKVPMRILTVQEIRKLAGLESILTTERHGNSLLTEQVIRDFCGNSFHPSLISAALGTDDQLQQWVHGTNDAQPCATELPCVRDA